MLKIALVGNPNSGKTTLFNSLTGSTAHVGNWPGVTVDKKEGTYKKGKLAADIIDLPGIYSLSPYTPEEVIARNYILDEKPDCVINIVDATNLERNLYLTTQLMELDVPVVVALNMTDILKKNGESVDAALLEKNIGLPVAEISALQEKGIDVLMEKALDAAAKPRKGASVLSEIAVGKAIANAENALELKGVASPLFHAVKLVEKDELEVEAHPREAKAVEEFVKINCSEASEFGCDTEAEIADARYKYIASNFSVAIRRNTKRQKGSLTKSDKVDRVLTNRWAAIPIFLVVLFAVFHLTFSEDLLYLGTIIKPFGEWCGTISEHPVGAIFFAGGINSPGVILFNALCTLTDQIGVWLGMGLEALNASDWVMGLVVDGIWGGIAAVLSFLPQILVLFLFFSILEDSGYMARVAFILDRIFRRFGVSGRAFMPMIMGFGCSIPAMANTRTLANDKEREATIRVIPFFSCGAKLPILTAIAGGIVMVFGVGNADVITYSMYIIGIVAAIVSLLIMRHTTMRGETPPFIMELPSYHMPRFKNLMIHLWDKTKHYVKKAFTIILVSCIVIWFLSNFGWNWKMTTMDNSILASLGQLIQPIFTPLGFGSQLGTFGWVFAVAAVTGLIAKENVIATFFSLACALVTLAGSEMSSLDPSILLQIQDVVASGEGTEEGFLEVAAMIGATGITIPGLISFIVFNMTTIPCFAAVATAKGEIAKGKFKGTLIFWLAGSYIISAIVYAFGTMFNHPIANGNVWSIFVSIGIIILAAIAVLGIVLYNKKMNKKEAQAKLLGNN